MPIVSGEMHSFRLELKSPLVTGGVSVRHRAGFLVALTSEGCTGWGEASPLPGWSRTTVLQTEASLRQALEAVGGSAEDAVEAALAALDDAPHARAGIAGAWADVEAQRAGRTLADHLADGAGRAAAPPTVVAVNAGASASPTVVAVNALIVEADPADVARAALEAVRAGFKAVKLKVGAADPTVDVERVRAARSALGPAPELRLDANGAWDDSTALDVLGQVAGCAVAFCEEPVSGIEAIASLGERCPVEVAVDESVRGESDAVRALAAGVRTLIVKPQALGGPDVALSIAARARKAGASTVVTSFLDSAVGVAHALHVAAAVDAADAAGARPRAHGLATAGLLSQDVAEPPPVTAGAMSLPSSPGLGISPSPNRRSAASGA